MLGYWGGWNDWQSCVHVVAKLMLDPSDGVFGRFDLAALCGCRTLNFCLFVCLLCGCASVHCAPRPTALQHAGTLQSWSSCHLLVSLQAVHWCYWLVLGFRVKRVLAAELSLQVTCMKNMQET